MYKSPIRTAVLACVLACPWQFLECNTTFKHGHFMQVGSEVSTGGHSYTWSICDLILSPLTMAQWVLCEGTCPKATYINI